MAIHIVGSEGFIGKAIQEIDSEETLVCWSHANKDNSNLFDLYNANSWVKLLECQPSTVIFLSWPGLPNYNELFHVTVNLRLCLEFFEKLVKSGCKKILVAGTCYEYGELSGCLHEDVTINPPNLYAIAKDSLRRSLEIFCHSGSTRLVWARVFYPYGLLQNPNSLFPSLVKAIVNQETAFEISSGRQIRDFIPVSALAKQLLILASHSDSNGIYNCGTGNPISIYEFVEGIIKDYDSSIKIKSFAHPDRTDESLAFWADMSKMNNLLLNSSFSSANEI